MFIFLKPENPKQKPESEQKLTFKNFKNG